MVPGALFYRLKACNPANVPRSGMFCIRIVVENIAKSYIDAGSDMVETNTFGGSRHKLNMFDLGDRTYELNKAGAELSRKAAGEDKFVIGSIGPSGAILMMGDVTEDELYEGFLDQAKGLAEGGIDAFCIETFSALDEAELAIKAAKTTGLPIICTFTFENGFFHDGRDA